jgi:hypothetical protein
MALGRVSAYHPGMAQILSIDARITGPIEPYSLWYGRCLMAVLRSVGPISIERILRRPRLSPTLIGRMLLNKAGKIADRWNIPVVNVVKTDATRP